MFVQQVDFVKHSKNYYIAGIVMCLLALSFGGYYDFVSTIFASVLIVVFLFQILSGKCKIQEVTDSFWFGCMLFAGYGLSIFYAVDSGIAVEGFAKKSLFFVWGCFLLLLNKKEKEGLLFWVPYIGAVMVLSCGIAYFIPGLREYVFVQNRLSGWFQYANTCGGFLLAGGVLLFQKEKKSKWDYAALLLLLVGILMTGSRSTMLLLVVSFCYFMLKKPELRKWLCLGGAALILIIFALVVITGNTDNIARITTIFTNSSTVFGRALYNFDGITQVWKHPFGLGYLGFYFIQNKVQTGVYSVRYVHNDWLQIGLDIGVIPMLFILAILIRNLWKQRKKEPYFMVLLVLFLQGFMEFNIEYSVMGLLLMLCLQEQTVPVVNGKVIKRACLGVCAIALIPLIYVSVPLTLAYMDHSALALKYYPWETNEQLKQLSVCTDEAEAKMIAKNILARNETCFLAYDALAIVAINEGEYEEAVAYMKKSIEYNRFEVQGYEQLEWLLSQIIEQEVVEDSSYYQMEYQNLQRLKEENQAAVSYFGRKIRDKVQLLE